MEMRYKKWLMCFLLLWCSFLLVNYSYAGEFKEADMNNVWFRFCNDGTGNDQLKSNITLSLDWGARKNICLYFFNVWDKTVDFVYWFSEGKIGKYGEEMCEADMTTGNKFSKLIPFTHERRISVKGHTYQTIDEEIRIPLWMSGVVYWCIAYKLEDPEYKGMGWMFDLVVRRTAHINLFVWGEGTIKNAIKILPLTGGVFTTNKKIKAELDEDNRLKMSFLVENEGNITQDVNITWRIYNVFWFEKNFSIDHKKLAPWEKFTFTSDMGMLPFYKWFFKVQFFTQNTPIFDFDVGGIDDKLKQTWFVEENASLFMFSRAVVILAVILIFILYRAFFLKKKQSNIQPNVQ